MRLVFPSTIRGLGILFALVAGAPTPGVADPPTPFSIACLRAEDERRVDAAVLRALEGVSPGARRRAALTLGRIGTPEAVNALVHALGLETEARVRSRMAFALGIAGSTRGLRVLLDALARDPDPEVRERAAEAVGRIGGPGVRDALEAALASLPGFIDGPVDRLGRALVVALYRRDDRRSVPALRAALEIPGATRAHAVWALGRWGDARALPDLLDRAGDPDPWIRKWSIRGLGVVAGGADRPSRMTSIVGAVRAGLSDEDHGVRVSAIRASRSVADPTLVAPLIGIASGDGPSGEPLEALAVLGSYGTDPRVGPYLRVVADETGARGSAARAALMAVRPDAAAALLSRRHLRPDHRLDRLDWVRMLESVPGPTIDRTLLEIATGVPPWLVTDRVVRHAAVDVLSRREGAVTPGFWEARLTGGDPLDRSLAVDALLERRGVGAIPALMEAARDGKGRFEEEEFRIALARGLISREEPEARQALEVLAHDPSRLVRQAANAGLPPSAQVETPRDPGRSDEDYEVAIRTALDAAGATIVTDRGSIRIRFFGAVAPLTVVNFITLARSGFWDRLPISRVVPDFVVQMGDERGDLNGSPGYTIRCENSELDYRRGRVGMALAGKDTGGCQFFVTHSAQPHLDGSYPVFAEVTEGLEVLDRIERGDRIRRILVHP